VVCGPQIDFPILDDVEFLLDECFFHERNPEFAWLLAVSAEDQLVQPARVLHCRQSVVHRHALPLAEVPETKPKLTCDHENIPRRRKTPYLATGRS